METLFAKTKIAHSRRVFCKDKSVKTKLIMKDIEKGFSMFLDNNEVKSRKGGTMSDHVAGWIARDHALCCGVLTRPSLS